MFFTFSEILKSSVAISVQALDSESSHSWRGKRLVRVRKVPACTV